jgi:prolyl-tRNA synthetase
VKYATAEVGNIFNFGTQKATDLGLTVKNQEGQNTPVWMGSYGVGVTRLMGVLVEKFADEKGLVWPESVAPFPLHLVSLGRAGDAVTKAADALYDDLRKAGKAVLYDDRDLSAGQKFAESDLLGIPTRIVVGREAAETGVFEAVARASGALEKKPRAALFA